MLLAFDIGNTDTVIGLFKDDRLIGRSRTPSASLGTTNDIWKLIRLSCRKYRIDYKVLTGTVISSVVPRVTSIAASAVKRRLHLKPVIVSGSLKRLGIRIRYDKPSSLGADRICNAVAAYEKFGGPAIVVDFGTAVTYDVIGESGDFLGGIIAPGIATAAAALERSTARLPAIELKFPRTIIGTNTAAGMQSGVLFGTVSAAEGIVGRLKQIMGKETPVIGTGGSVRLIARNSTLFDHLEPFLVLEGARLIYERVRAKRME